MDQDGEREKDALAISPVLGYSPSRRGCHDRPSFRPACAGHPFSSLIGHMDFDPACRIELTEEEHRIVRIAALAKGQSTEDYILASLGLAPRT